MHVQSRSQTKTYTAEDEPTLRLFSFQADQTPVAFYGVATPSQTTVSPILGFRVYITST